MPENTKVRATLKSMHLTNFKGFREHTIYFKSANVLLGANNAGKSTALSALRLVVAMLPQARRVKPSSSGRLDGGHVRGWPVTAASVESAAFSTENLRNDFRQEETRVELIFSNDARLVVSWPELDDLEALRGMYFAFAPDGGSILDPRTVTRDLIPDMAVIPTLTPLDDTESWVADATLRKQIVGRRSSRYFRNALARMRYGSTGDWESFRSFVLERTPEVRSLELVRRIDSGVDELDLFFTEPGSRGEREIGWAGDGLQIWVQFLYHVWVNGECSVLVLDEPDVFLHPDFQRRLARIAFEGSRQVVIATHSIEMLAESPPGSAVWVDRGRRRSQRPKGDGALSLAGRRLGSGFELGVGRALRSRNVLFVEGDDIGVVAAVARVLGCESVARGDGYATVPLGGFSRNSLAPAFAETLAALGAGVRIHLLLDGDLRSLESRQREFSALESGSAEVTIWKRREIENYLLTPASVSKAARIPLPLAERLVRDAISSQEDSARTDLAAQRFEERKAPKSSTAGLSSKTVIERANEEFRTIWGSEAGRLGVVDVKAIMRDVNAKLQGVQGSINATKLAKSLRVEEVDSEMSNFIRGLEASILAERRSSS